LALYVPLLEDSMLLFFLSELRLCCLFTRHTPVAKHCSAKIINAVSTCQFSALLTNANGIDIWMIEAVHFSSV
jgi:hypothetical protein